MHRLLQGLKNGLLGFVLLGVCALLMVAYSTQNKPHKSALDARMLSVFEMPTGKTFLNGSWMKATESFLDDRILGRTRFLELHQSIAQHVFAAQEVAGVWTDPKTHFMFDPLPVLRSPLDYQAPLAHLRATTSQAGVPLLMVYVPRKQEVFADILPKHWDNTYLDDKAAIIDQFNQAGTTLDLTPIVADPTTRTKNFYRTDHHWRYSGAIAARNAVAAQLLAMGVASPQPIPTLDQVRRYPQFIGSVGRRLTAAGVPQPDVFEIPWVAHSGLTRCSEEPLETPVCSKPILVDSIGKGKDPYTNRYATFLGGDNGIDDIRGSGTGTFIILKDSFGDAFVPYFALGAKRVVSIDERHYSGAALSQVIAQVHPDAVIFLHNQLSMSTLTTEQMALWR